VDFCSDSWHPAQPHSDSWHPAQPHSDPAAQHHHQQQQQQQQHQQQQRYFELQQQQHEVELEREELRAGVKELFCEGMLGDRFGEVRCVYVDV